MSLYIIDQIQTLGSTDISLMIIYFLSIIIAISVIIVKSPVVSILYLIGLFCTIAIYLVKSGMNFAGLIYLLVYVGAISILFIFIVMLLNVRISELLTEGRNSTVLALFSVVSIYFLFSRIIPGSEGFYYVVQLGSAVTDYVNHLSESSNLTDYSSQLTAQEVLTESNVSSKIPENFSTEVASVYGKSWDNSLAEISHISSVGNIFYTILIVNLIVISLIILLAMIGAIVITVKSITKFTENELNTNVSTRIDLNS